MSSTLDGRHPFFKRAWYLVLQLLSFCKFFTYPRNSVLYSKNVITARRRLNFDAGPERAGPRDLCDLTAALNQLAQHCAISHLL